jgi:hypothetical protein
MNESRFYVVSLNYSDGSGAQLIGVYSSLERAQAALGRIFMEGNFRACKGIREVAVDIDIPESERGL